MENSCAILTSSPGIILVQRVFTGFVGGGGYYLESANVFKEVPLDIMTVCCLCAKYNELLLCILITEASPALQPPWQNLLSIILCFRLTMCKWMATGRNCLN